MELVIVFVYVVLCVVVTLVFSRIGSVYNKFRKKGIDYEARSYGKFYKEFNNSKVPFMYSKQNEKKYKKLIKKYKHKQIKHDVRIVNSSLKMVEYSNAVIGYMVTGATIYIAILANNMVQNLTELLNLKLQGEIIYKGIVVYLYIALIIIMIRNIKIIKAQYIYIDIATEILNSKE